MSRELKIAGCLQNYTAQWLETCGKNWVTDIISHGYSPEWNQLPPLRKISLSYHNFDIKDLSSFQQEIQHLLSTGAIQEMDLQEPCFVSRLFMVPKKSGDLRAVIDLRQLNQYIMYQHFKMEGLEVVKSLIRRGDYMMSIDLNQAFYHIPLAANQRRYFAFDFLERRYCFTCLPFGLTTSPRVFTKILKPIVNLMREKGIRTVAYLDDILIIASSKEEVLQHTNFLIDCLQRHGLTINLKKSFL